MTFPRRIAPIAIFIACFAAYIVWAHDYRFNAEWTQIASEGPLLAYAFVLLRAPLRQRWWRSVVAALPFVWLYWIHDEYFLRWGDVPSFGDVGMLRDFLVVLTPGEGAGLVLALILPALLWLVSLARPRLSRGGVLLALPAVVGLATVLVAPVQSYNFVWSLTPETEWSDRTTAEEWGRLYAAILRQMRRPSLAAQLADFEPLAQSPLHLSPAQISAIDGRNVHIIVMESFVDVRLLANVQFSRPPFDDEFAAWVDSSIGTSLSPAFGGETARAEFEILCGVPALRVLGLEFAGFTGARTYCLPTILGEAGYRSVLTFPYGPVFFNTRRAYPGLGFDQVIYADRFSKPDVESIVTPKKGYIEDGDFFPQNLSKVRALLAEKKPFLNYIMTLYGHWPFEIDEKRHPREITVTPPHAEIERIANQMLLRTRALHAHVKALVALDPKSIIVLMGDHLPSLPEGTADYLRYGYHERSGFPKRSPDVLPYENFLLVLVDGVPRKLPAMRHFDMSHWVLRELTAGASCNADQCEFGVVPFDKQHYLSRYKTILGVAAGH